MLKLFLCTTFLLSSGGRHVVGKSYDWDMSQGLVFVNKRGVQKQGLPSPTGGSVPQWKSKYASLTFNQYGREIPNGGMNEKGLVIEIMWLDSSVYPPADQRPSIDGLQWIQYQLDNYATVAEMVAHADDLRIAMHWGKVHYLACDPSAACAAFEHIDGKMVVSRDAHALTNNTFAESKGFLKAHPGGAKGKGSLERYSRAANHKPHGDPIDDAFATLADVSQGDDSKWNIVYDLDQKKVYWRSRGSEKIKQATLGAFDPSCRAPVQMMDLEADAVAFKDYDEDANRKLIARSLAPVAEHLPPGVSEMLARYPRMLGCAESPGAERAVTR